MLKKPVFVLIIPEWENYVHIGVIAPKYYKASNKTPDSIRDNYEIKNVFGDYYYVNKDGSRVEKKIKNIGGDKMWQINGQAFYSNTMHWKTRSKIVTYYHKYISDFITGAFNTPFPTFLGFRLDMHIDICEIYSSKLPDITNMWILPKMIEDSFVNSKILRDDNPEFRGATSFGYTFTKDKASRKLVITFKYSKNVPIL